MPKVVIHLEIFDNAAFNPNERQGTQIHIILDEADLLAIATLRGMERGTYNVSIEEVYIMDKHNNKVTPK